jgi:hypothetical protein
MRVKIARPCRARRRCPGSKIDEQMAAGWRGDLDHLDNSVTNLVTKNQAANKSYAARIESSLMTGTRMRQVGQYDQADAWERHSNDWCLRAAGYMSPVGLVHALVEGSYHSAVLWGVLLGPVALLWLVGSLVIGTVRWVGRDFIPIE